MRSMLPVLGILIATVLSRAAADQVEMQNGDHYTGTVVSVSSNTVVLESPNLGKVSVPRTKVAHVSFGTATSAPVAAAAPRTIFTNVPASATLPALKSSTDLSAALRAPGSSTNSIQSLRQQLLATSPEAAGKFDEMLGGLSTGKLDVNDVRREAQATADQVRKLKAELGPDADDSLDGYLAILDGFLKETAGATNATSLK